MYKTTVTDNSETRNSQPTLTGNQHRKSFRYFLAIVPVVLVLLISTSYQQNHNDVNYFKRDDFAPEVRDSLKNFLAAVHADALPFSTCKSEWTFIKNFYKENGFRPVWIHLKGLDDRALHLVQLIGQAREFGLEPDNYHISTIRKLIADFEKEKDEFSGISMDFKIEILLTDAAFRMMIHLHSGYQPLDSAFSVGRIFGFPEILMKGITENDISGSILSVEPQFMEYINLRHAAADFLTVSSLNNAVLKDQDDSLDENNSLYRYRLLALNLDRLRKRKYADSRMIYVNIPSYSLKIIEKNHLADTFRIIVGNPTTPTPQLSGTMETVVANPVWYVPRSIAMEEILPKLKSDTNYLERNGFTVLDRHYRAVDSKTIGLMNIQSDDFDYTFRQKRGADNSLGKVKFLFTNPHSVYLHDTPGKTLFAKENRAFSHGCIRVQHPERLANYILHEINADTTQFEQLLETGQQHEFKLASPLAIHITYITCEADNNGNVNFYKDIYGIDKKELAELATFQGGL
jgi:L,D-transpeptidase YcbB